MPTYTYANAYNNTLKRNPIEIDFFLIDLVCEY